MFLYTWIKPLPPWQGLGVINIYPLPFGVKIFFICIFFLLLSTKTFPKELNEKYLNPKSRVYPGAGRDQGNMIVVTHPYLKDLLDNILCKNPEYKITSIITAGVDPHTFILTPNDRILLKNADTIIQIGAGLEFWMDKIKFNNTQNHLVLSEHQPIHDTHIWQSPEITQKVVNIIAENLIKQNPKNKKNIEYCTQNYILKIHSTVGDLKKQLSFIPKENRIIATNHDSLGYFAEAFDFKIYSILGLSDDEQPSIKQLKYLITLLQQKHIKSVFLESTGNTKNIQIVAQNAHVSIGGKLYGDSLGEKGSGADTTLKMWQTNVLTLVKALK